MQRTIIDILDALFNSIKYSIRDILLLPGTNFQNICIYSIALMCISLVAEVFDIIPFIDWRGCLIAALLSGVVIGFGRKKYDKGE